MVEFALVLPVLVLVLFAIVELGLTFKDYLTMTDAVRAGARVAAVSRSNGQAGAAEDAVREAAVNLDQAQLGVAVTSTWQRGTDVTVTATYPYEINLFGLPVYSGDLTSQTTERVE
jgi:Flp pilus assembly protein TadG